MNTNKLFTRLILAFGLFLVAVSAMAVPVVAVSVRAELVGSEFIFHYTLTHSGPELITEFEVAVRPSGYGCEVQTTGETLCMGNYFGTLSLLPTGTTWRPAVNLKGLRDEPVLASGTATAPPNWVMNMIGVRGEGLYKMQWEIPFGEYYYQPNTQPSSLNFSVRVPASPDPRAEYMNGLFHIQYFMNDTRQDLHAQIILPPDTIPPAISVTLTPSLVKALPPGQKYIQTPTYRIIAAITASDNLDPLPVIKLESMTLDGAPYVPSRPYSLRGGNDPEGTATFGTDDRAFALGVLTRAAVYTVTYSATDASGNKTLATRTVTVR